MRFSDIPTGDDFFRARFRQQWERRFDQAAPLWAVELALAFRWGHLMIVGTPMWPALRNIAEMVRRIEKSSDGRSG
jgi:hypothetical protein